MKKLFLQKVTKRSYPSPIQRGKFQSISSDSFLSLLRPDHDPPTLYFMGHSYSFPPGSNSKKIIPPPPSHRLDSSAQHCEDRFFFFLCLGLFLLTFHATAVYFLLAPVDSSPSWSRPSLSLQLPWTTGSTPSFHWAQCPKHETTLFLVPLGYSSLNASITVIF